MARLADNPFLEGNDALRSLNRLTVAALPAGLEDALAADGIVDRVGYRLLGAVVLRGMVADEASRRGAGIGGRDPLDVLEGWFEMDASRSWATAIAGAFGRRLGTLLVVLHQGSDANRAARTEWQPRHWAWWGGVRTVIVGGGLLAGHAGPIAVAAAQDVLARARADLDVVLAPHPAHLPLIGMARACPPRTDLAAILDLGQTRVKCAAAVFRDASVAELRWLGSEPAPCAALDEPDPVLATVRERWESIAGAVERTWTLGGLAPARNPAVAMAIGTYLDDGQPPASDNGCYTVLRLLAPNLAAFAAADLAQRLRTPFPCLLRGDGDAAAFAFAGAEDSAVVTLGTAIGVGFPPPASAARPLADDFALIVA